MWGYLYTAGLGMGGSNPLVLYLYQTDTIAFEQDVASNPMPAESFELTVQIAGSFMLDATMLVEFRLNTPIVNTLNVEAF